MWRRIIALALAGTAVGLVGGLVAYRWAVQRGPSVPFPTEDDTRRAELQAILGRMARKHQVAGDVIAGRLSLLEAAAAFRDLDAEGPPNIPIPIRQAFSAAASDDEAYCRSVLEYVGSAPPELTRRLTDELNARLRDGALRLPEP